MHISDIFRWVVAVVLGLAGWWVIFLNFHNVYVWVVRREHHSVIPLICGLFAFVGMGVCPLLSVRRLAWVPVVVDVGFFVSTMTIGWLMQSRTGRVGKKGDDV